MIDLALAFKLIDELNYDLQIEEVDLENALNRILAEPIIADRDYPPFNRAAMDGIAINTNDYSDNTFTTSVVETIYAGMPSLVKLNQKEAYRIMTGASVPNSSNAIIPFEKLTWINETNAKFNFLPNALENIAKQGEDLKKGDTWQNKNLKINAYLMGILSSLGYSSVKTIKPPKVLIISAGDELISIREKPSLYQIRSSSQFVLNAMFKQYGVLGVSYVQIKDNKDEFSAILEKEIKNIDLVVTTGGVSAGDNDFIPSVYQSLGFKKIFHKVAIKPGKPVWLGFNEDKKCLAFGLPGNPVSTQISFILFIQEWLNNWFGLAHKKPLLFSLTNPVKKNKTLDVFLPANIVATNNLTKIKPIYNNGSGDFISSGLMEGFIKISKGEGITNENDFFEWYTLT